MSFIKRIVLTVTVLATVLMSCTACKGEYADLEPFTDALSDSAPIGAMVRSEIDTELGLIGADYTAVYSDGVIAVDYTKDAVSTITPDTDEDGLFYTDSGTATVNKDGTVNGELGALVKSVLTLGLALDGDAIDYEASEKTLRFTVTAENTERVFGVNIGYPATVRVELSDARVASIIVMYTAASGDASLTCEFEY